MNERTVTWADAERRLLADAETREAYDALEDRFRLVRELLAMRNDAGLTQAQLAQRMGVTQGRVAQIESLGAASLPSLSSIRRYASACGHRAVVTFEPLEAAPTARPALRRVAESEGPFPR